MSERKFQSAAAKRSKVPLLIGIAGPSGGGKTFSALRLAKGIQTVTGGDIHFIDTENGRACHYADQFNFKHVPFDPPYNPLSYLSAIEYCCDQGPGPIVVDSTSHEHDGEGGVLDMHDTEVQRMAGGDWQKAERVKMLAWVKPKAERRKLLNAIVRLNRNIIFCFRAKPKMKIQKGKDPIHLGYMPIAGDEFVFEMTVSALLMPNAGGVPSWNPHEDGEKQMVKLPLQFREMLLTHNGPLDESLGQRMAEWAAGVDPTEIHLRKIVAAATLDELAAAWKSIPAPIQVKLAASKDRRKAELNKPVEAEPESEYEPDPDKPPKRSQRSFAETDTDTAALMK